MELSRISGYSLKEWHDGSALCLFATSPFRWTVPKAMEIGPKLGLIEPVLYPIYATMNADESAV
ncbi:hypothetical protein L208DRAFT_1397711, partial [Tricholoma matsutake]